MDEDNVDRKRIDEREDGAAEGVKNEPRGNPEVDQDSVDKGVDQLERVKPY